MPYKDPEKARRYRRLYYQTNRERELERDRRYYQDNRDRIRLRNQESRTAAAEYYREYRRKNRERIANRMQEYYTENRDYLLEVQRAYAKDIPQSRIAQKYAARLVKYDAVAELSSVRGRYTPHEDYVIMDESLTNIQRAVILGRTVVSVSHRRQALRKKGLIP